MKSRQEKSEQERKERLSSRDVAKIALAVIGGAGIITLGLAAPGIFELVRTYKSFKKSSARRYRSPAHVRKIVEKLHKRGLVRVFTREGETMIRLTEKGALELSRYRMKEKIPKQRRWDEKWRIIIFDIQEKRRFTRDRIRRNIEEFGFLKLQNSVWIYPYECEELISLLKAEHNIGKEILYIVANDVEEAECLKKRFGLG